ncbi:hypothetical protein ACU4HD_44200 [Cupriavidus basilensis]
MSGNTMEKVASDAASAVSERRRNRREYGCADLPMQGRAGRAKAPTTTQCQEWWRRQCASCGIFATTVEAPGRRVAASNAANVVSPVLTRTSATTAQYGNRYACERIPAPAPDLRQAHNVFGEDGAKTCRFRPRKVPLLRAIYHGRCVRIIPRLPLRIKQACGAAPVLKDRQKPPKLSRVYARMARRP